MAHRKSHSRKSPASRAHKAPVPKVVKKHIDAIARSVDALKKHTKGK